MTIIINQKFPKCNVCGKMIPIGEKPLKLKASEKTLLLCSKWFLEYYKKYF